MGSYCLDLGAVVSPSRYSPVLVDLAVDLVSSVSPPKTKTEMKDLISHVLP